ncbi:MAG: TIGR03936 family radical SAM-associated protein [Bacillota bacterium]|nr:TIGR03936 family radical SAM-associated protein [Bacillota bacterium]
MPILRLKAKKNGRLRFLSHLESLKMLERSMRRADVPMKFSNGFNPHPNISFASPLPVGSLSDYEIIDVDVIFEFDIEEIISDQAKYFPVEFRLIDGYFIENGKSLMSQVASADYSVKINADIKSEDIKEAIENFLSKESVVIKKKTKRGRYIDIDIREQVQDLIFDDEVEMIFMRIDTGSVSNLKPLALLDQLMVIPHEKVDVLRTKLYKGEEGRLVELF